MVRNDVLKIRNLASTHTSYFAGRQNAGLRKFALCIETLRAAWRCRSKLLTSLSCGLIQFFERNPMVERFIMRQVLKFAKLAALSWPKRIGTGASCAGCISKNSVQKRSLFFWDVTEWRWSPRRSSLVIECRCGDSIGSGAILLHQFKFKI